MGEGGGGGGATPAALDTEYAMVLPCVEAPAMEDVIRKTPPSGLALNVGAALRRRWRWDLVLMAQHCFACYFFFFLSIFFVPTSLFFFYIHTE